MRNLLFREFYMGKKRFLTMFGLFFIFGLLGILIRLSMLHGNLADVSLEIYYDIDRTTFVLFAYVPLLILLASGFFVIETIADDYKSKWIKYAFTTPVSNRQWVTIKYCAVLILTGLSLIISVAYMFLFMKISKHSFKLKYIKNYCIIALFFTLLISILISMIYLLKNINKVINLSATIFITLSIVITFWLMSDLDKFTENHTEIPADATIFVYISDLKSRIHLNGFSKIIIILSVLLLIYVNYLLAIKLLNSIEDR